MKLSRFLFDVNFSECIQQGINEFARQAGYNINNNKAGEDLPTNFKNKKKRPTKNYLIMLLIIAAINILLLLITA